MPEPATMTIPGLAPAEVEALDRKVTIILALGDIPYIALTRPGRGIDGEILTPAECRTLAAVLTHAADVAEGSIAGATGREESHA